MRDRHLPECHWEGGMHTLVGAGLVDLVGRIVMTQEGLVGDARQGG